jgi:hypothetical protein
MPEIEWHVGEEAEQETIAQITTSKPSRWRKPIVLAMAALGLGLGALYAAIPEPAQPIAPPAPIATALPPVSDPDLAAAIDREARALANGDMQTFSGLLDPDDYRWRQDQLSSLTPWGPPNGGAPPSSAEFYRILASDRSDAQHAWADVVQARDGKFFRETRFYRLRDGEWVRSQPLSDPAWWGDETLIATRYFQLTHTTADEEPARLLAGYLARQSRETCRLFGCNFDERPPVVHFVLQPNLTDPQQQGVPGGSTLTVTLPSPRLAGYYTTDFSGVDIDDAAWNQYFVGPLYFLLLSTTVGGPERWEQKRDGMMYLFVIGLWDLSRRKPSLEGLPDFPYMPELMTETVSLATDEMWQWPVDLPEADTDLRLARASALVDFIDETYGGDTVIRFFRTLRFAQSLPHALSRIGVPYDELETKWQAWIERHVIGAAAGS